MKLSGATIQLTGHLARNESLVSLKTGTIVNARVLERISATDAKIDLKGSVVVAHFERGVPSGQTVRLRLVESRGNMLVFQGEDASRGALPGSPASAAIAHYISKHGVFPDTVAPFLRQLAGEKEDPDRSRRRELALKLAAAGFETKDAALFSRLLVMHGGGLELFMRAFDDSFPDALESMLNDPRFEDTVSPDDYELIMGSLAGERRPDSFYIADEDRLVECRFFEDASCVAVSFELSRAGRIDIVGYRKDSRVFADVFIEDAGFHDQACFYEVSGKLRERGIDVLINPVLRGAVTLNGDVPPRTIDYTV